MGVMLSSRVPRGAARSGGVLAANLLLLKLNRCFAARLNSARLTVRRLMRHTDWHDERGKLEKPKRNLAICTARGHQGSATNEGIYQVGRGLQPCK